MPPNDPCASRRRKLARALKREGLDAMLIADRANTFYLSGFRGSASLIVQTLDETLFFTDFRYITHARATLSGMKVRLAKVSLVDALGRLNKRLKAKRIGFEGTVSFNDYRAWNDSLKNAELVESGRLVAELREIKTAEEVKRIERAQRIAEEILKQLLVKCRPGVTEKALAGDLLRAIETAGGDGPSFDPIVASGPNAALPHAVPTDRRIRRGDFVIFDMGVRLDGYCSDMTRTVVVGKATDRQREVYETVLAAQKRAIKKVAPDVRCRTIDRAARSWIEKRGFGKAFGHGTGHGVGLEVHESPRLSTRSEDCLRPGMVVTIEPGIYIHGWGGVRIEDMVLVRKSGRRNLTDFPSKLTEIKAG